MEHKRISVLIIGGTTEERSIAGRKIADVLADDGEVFSVNGKKAGIDYTGEQVILFAGYTPRRFYIDFGYKDSRKILGRNIGETILNSRLFRHKEGILQNLFSVVCTSGTEEDFYKWTTNKKDAKDYFLIEVDMTTQGVYIRNNDCNAEDLDSALSKIYNVAGLELFGNEDVGRRILQGDEQSDTETSAVSGR